MTKSKIAIIKNVEFSSWVSCQTITKNLISSYKNLSSYESRVFYQPDNASEMDHIKKLYVSILKYKPDIIVFVDHKPHPGILLSFLYRVMPDTRYVFHLYGDYTLYSEEWCKLNPYLAGGDLIFIAPSTRQMNLVGRTLEKPFNLHTVSFPIDVKEFAYKGSSRKNRMKKSPYEIFYSGRVSFQKNVPQILQLFEDSLRSKSAVLKVAGEFDSIGAPYFGINQNIDSEFFRVTQKRRELAIPSSQVIFLGQLKKASLKRTLVKSDVFVSLSTYHDEDFGMAPLEALCSGIPSVLSSWGGYSGFQTKSKYDPFLINVKMTSQGPVFWGPFPKESQIYDWINESDSFRVQRSEHFKELFSIKSCSTKLTQILQSPSTPFNGFSDLFKRHATAMRTSKLNNTPLFSLKNFNKSSLYYKMYSSYWESR